MILLLMRLLRWMVLLVVLVSICMWCLVRLMSLGEGRVLVFSLNMCMDRL